MFKVSSRTVIHVSKAYAESVGFGTTDHILMLETSLRHFDYILSHCQPAYMSHINVSYGYQRGRTDQFLVVLTGITIGTLPIAVMVGEPAAQIPSRNYLK